MLILLVISVRTFVQRQQEASSEKDSKNDPPDDDIGTGTLSADGGCEPKASHNNEKYYQGKLLIDATCTPSDIAYPTGVGLLNNAREKLETMIYTLHKPLAGKHVNHALITRKHGNSSTV